MIRSLTTCFALSLIIIFACDKGLSPPDDAPHQINFPIPPEGGNPVGFWLPDTTNPMEVTLLTDMGSAADSVVFDTELEGIFSFEFTGACSVHAIMTLIPIVYNNGQSVPLGIVIVDTLKGIGQYDLMTDEVLFLPIESEVMNLDTVGFTHRQTKLDLISLPTSYTWQNFITIEFYSLIHLTRQPSRPKKYALPLHRIEEGRR